MFLLKFILTASVVVGFVLFLICWLAHLEMNMCGKWGWGNYKKFLGNFQKYNWRVDNTYWSLFDRNNNSQIHASIIEFEGKRMALFPISWVRASILKFKVIYKYKKSQKVKW